MDNLNDKLSNEAPSQPSCLGVVSSSASGKPHCWGKMTWILKYEDGQEPKTSICNCEHGAMKCKSLTRQNAS